MQPVYNSIGKTYDTTRKADPGLAKTLLELLAPKTGGHYLDIGCGSGNYTNVIHTAGYDVMGIDVSEEMLGKAKKKYPGIEWNQGDARALPFPDNRFDGATCFLATHHIKDIDKAFNEVHRVLNKGNFVIFTSFREQMGPYWLNRYFPEMMQLAAQLMHSKTEIIDSLEDAGFGSIKLVPYYVTNALQDWFLQSGKYRPEIYLDPAVRAGISTFALMSDHDEIKTGCEMLRKDIASGAIEKVIAEHESDLGDYVFVSCSK